MATVFSDLNVRLPEVNNSDTLTIYDSAAVTQSLIRLTKTREGSIPFFRQYGLNLEQFLHLPLTTSTAQDIINHCYDKINTYETRVNIVDSFTSANIDLVNGNITVKIVVQDKTTGELISIPPFTVNINTIN